MGAAPLVIATGRSAKQVAGGQPARMKAGKSRAYRWTSAMKKRELEQSEVLFGADPEKGIVAVEPVGQSALRLFITESSELRTRGEVFTPFVLVEDEEFMQGGTCCNFLASPFFEGN